MTRTHRGIKRPRHPRPGTPIQEAFLQVIPWLRSWEDELDDRSADELVESLEVFARRRKADRARARGERSALVV